MTRHPLLLSGAGLALTALAVALTAGHPTAQLPPLASRIVATEATKYRPLTSVHAGAGNMAFAGLLNRGAIGAHFNFLHRGEIPPGSGIGHHFHNTVEEMSIRYRPSSAPGSTAPDPAGRRPGAGRCSAVGTSTKRCDVAPAVRADGVPIGLGLCGSCAGRAGRQHAGGGARRIGEVYYVLAGSGTVKVGAETAPVQRWNAIPIALGETSAFTSSGAEPLELLVVAVARDMETKTVVMRGVARL